MSDLLARVSSEPVAWGLLTLALGAIAYTVFKKLLKWAMILVFGFAALLAYLTFTGQDSSPAAKTLKKAGLETAEATKKHAEALWKRGTQAVKDDLGKGLDPRRD